MGVSTANVDLVAVWQKRLSAWQSVSEFQSAVDQCKQELGLFGPMLRADAGFWRDAWIASRYAQLVEASEVRLHSDPAPDFEICLRNSQLQFEATEVLDPLRRRANEYREDIEKIERSESTARADPEEDWLTPELAMSELEKASEKKVQKTYVHAAKCGLVIYLNMSDYGFREEEILAVMTAATQSSGKVFHSVDILWRDQLHRIW